MKAIKKVESKRKINENVLNNVVNWVSGLLNDTSHYMDANGASEYTKSGDFKLILATTLGIATIGTGLYFQDKIAAALKSAPDKIKKIIKSGKIIKNSQSREDAKNELNSIGIDLPVSKQQMTNEAKQIKKVLTILEAQVDRSSKNKTSRKR